MTDAQSNIYMRRTANHYFLWLEVDRYWYPIKKHGKLILHRSACIIKFRKRKNLSFNQFIWLNFSHVNYKTQRPNVSMCHGCWLGWDEIPIPPSNGTIGEGLKVTSILFSLTIFSMAGVSFLMIKTVNQSGFKSVVEVRLRTSLTLWRTTGPNLGLMSRSTNNGSLAASEERSKL